MKSVEQLRAVIDRGRVAAAGAVRRMAITLTSRALWQLAGFELEEREVVTAEPFLGIGFASRPPSSGKPEAIVVMVGDAKNPMIVAVRDEATRAAIAGALKLGETMVYTDKVFAHLKEDGTLEARKPAEAADFAALKRDLQRLKDAISDAAVVANDGGAAFKTNILAALDESPAWPEGSKTLKGGY